MLVYEISEHDFIYQKKISENKEKFLKNKEYLIVNESAYLSENLIDFRYRIGLYFKNVFKKKNNFEIEILCLNDFFLDDLNNLENYEKQNKMGFQISNNKQWKILVNLFMLMLLIVLIFIAGYFNLIIPTIIFIVFRSVFIGMYMRKYPNN